MKKQCIYRIISPTAILGYGYPEQSLQKAASKPVNLVACDAGSMDAGPYYLGSGKIYVERVAVKRDLALMLKVAIEHNCPLIIGNAGFAGSASHLEQFVTILKQALAELTSKSLKIALIDSSIDPKELANHAIKLYPLGKMPALTADQILKSSGLVGQMGIAPYIAALDAGAQIIISGRVCDVAIFAAAPVRSGVSPGLAYHAGHVLECGAIACLPGSGSDCIVAEFLDDESVIFESPNSDRITTPRSIAAHSLYEESHPLVQYYPEGILDLRTTEYFSHTSQIAGIRNSRFIHCPTSIKIEGAAIRGVRVISLISCSTLLPLSPLYRVYGKNGVGYNPIKENDNEMAIIVEVTGKNQEDIETLASLYKAGLLHFGYPGRRTTAGNLAYPMSPSTINFVNAAGQNSAIFIGGSREPIFIEKIESIFGEITKRIVRDYPNLLSLNSATLHVFDKDSPLVFVETVAENYLSAKISYNQILEQIGEFCTDLSGAKFKSLNAGDAYDWSIFHTIKDPKFIQQLFKIEIFETPRWDLKSSFFAPEISIGEIDGNKLNEMEINLIKEVKHITPPSYYRPLSEMVSILRSKDAGVNTITYDIFFNDENAYQQAIKSNVFTQQNLAKVLNLDEKDIIGCFSTDSCLALKVSCYRRVISGSPGSRDVFGAQQQYQFTNLDIAIY